MDNRHVRFQRGNYVVTDLERSLTFYRDALGLSVEFIKDSPGDSYSYDVFDIPHKHSMRFAVLSAPGQVRVMALTEIKDAVLERVPRPRRSAIVLEVGDVELVVNDARAAGCLVYEEDRLETHDGRIGREVGIVDFDDNLTVIYHIPKTS